MQTIIKNRKMSWINLFSPTAEELVDIQKKYGVHPLIVEELKRPTLRSKVEIFDDAIYLILHFPIYDREKRTCIGREIDFVIGKNFLITAHYEMIETLDRIAGVCDTDGQARDHCLGVHGGHLLFSILKPLYDYSLRELDQIHKKIGKIEDRIFSGHEHEMVHEISILRREILDFRRTMHPQEQVLASLEKVGEKFFPKTYHHYLAYISGEYFKLWNAIDNYRETIEALEETNSTLLTTNTNETIKILTIMAFITFPLSLLAGIFGMNAEGMPFVGLPGGFWIIITIMIVAMVAMFGFFKYKRWL